MKKSQMGYLLTETIIAITVVATVVIIVYGLTINYYVKQDNNVTKFNTPQGLYNAQQVKKLLSPIEDDYVNSSFFRNNGYVVVDVGNIKEELGIKKMFLSNKNMYNLTHSLNIPKRARKIIQQHNSTSVDKCAYRYVILYDDNSYAVIGTVCEE